jgi:hypothetical protein
VLLAHDVINTSNSVLEERDYFYNQKGILDEWSKLYLGSMAFQAFDKSPT